MNDDSATVTAVRTSAAQRLAFAVVASLLVHAALIQNTQGGTLTFKHYFGEGLKPLKVSMRSLAATTAPPRQQAVPRPASPRIDTARLPAVLFGTAPASAQEMAGLAVAPAPVAGAEAALAISAPWNDDPALATLWPDESGYGPYRPVSEVDVRPQPLAQIEPKFPERVGEGISGRALLLVMIGDNGQVDQVRVIASDPVEAFGNNAKAAFEQARFLPAELRGKPVPTYLMIEVNFS